MFWDVIENMAAVCKVGLAAMGPGAIGFQVSQDDILLMYSILSFQILVDLADYVTCYPSCLAAWELLLDFGSWNVANRADLYCKAYLAVVIYVFIFNLIRECMKISDLLYVTYYDILKSSSLLRPTRLKYQVLIFCF